MGKLPEIIRIFEINIIIIMIHVIYKADFNKRKVNVMVVTLTKLIKSVTILYYYNIK